MKLDFISKVIRVPFKGIEKSKLFVLFSILFFVGANYLNCSSSGFQSPTSTATIASESLNSNTTPTSSATTSSCQLVGSTTDNIGLLSAAGCSTACAAEASIDSLFANAICYSAGVQITYTLLSSTTTTSGGTTSVPVSGGSSGSSGLNYPALFTFYNYPLTFVAGQSIPSALPIVSGTANEFSVSPALPSGLTLNSTTGEISGTPTANQTSPSTSYLVVATNNGLITGSVAITLAVVIPVPQVNIEGLSKYQIFNIGGSSINLSVSSSVLEDISSLTYNVYSGATEWGLTATSFTAVRPYRETTPFTAQWDFDSYAPGVYTIQAMATSEGKTYLSLPYTVWIAKPLSLSLSASSALTSMNAIPGQAVNFYPSGGIPPYTYAVSGTATGLMSGNVFTVSSGSTLGQHETITVTDSNKNQASATVTVSYTVMTTQFISNTLSNTSEVADQDTLVINNNYYLDLCTNIPASATMSAQFYYVYNGVSTLISVVNAGVAAGTSANCPNGTVVQAVWTIPANTPVGSYQIYAVLSETSPVVQSATSPSISVTISTVSD